MAPRCRESAFRRSGFDVVLECLARIALRRFQRLFSSMGYRLSQHTATDKQRLAHNASLPQRAGSQVLAVENFDGFHALSTAALLLASWASVAHRHDIAKVMFKSALSSECLLVIARTLLCKAVFYSSLRCSHWRWRLLSASKCHRILRVSRATTTWKRSKNVRGPVTALCLCVSVLTLSRLSALILMHQAPHKCCLAT